MYFQALHELPFESHRQDFWPPKSKVVLTIFQYTSIAILILAWIDYVNVAISSNRKRMKEVAIRKTIGGKYADFIFQFMTEAMAVNIIAVAVAFSIIQAIRTPMEVLFAFYMPEYGNIALSTQAMLSGAFVVGVLFTGFYPAIVSLKQSPVSLFGFHKMRIIRIASVLLYHLSILRRYIPCGAGLFSLEINGVHSPQWHRAEHNADPGG